MPDPKDYLDDDMTYVRGYARRRRPRRKDSRPIQFLVVVGLLGLIGWFLWKSGIWIFLVIAGFIVFAIYVKLHWKKWKLARLEKRVNKLEIKQRDERNKDYLENRLKDLEEK